MLRKCSSFVRWKQQQFPFTWVKLSRVILPVAAGYDRRHTFSLDQVIPVCVACLFYRGWVSTLCQVKLSPAIEPHPKSDHPNHLQHQRHTIIIITLSQLASHPVISMRIKTFFFSSTILSNEQNQPSAPRWKWEETSFQFWLAATGHSGPGISRNLPQNTQ